MRGKNRFANMKLGVLSDTHDNVDAIVAAFRMFHERDVCRVIHCGDLTSPEMAVFFRAIPTHFVLGNCDSPLEMMKPAIESAGGVVYESVGFMEFGGRRIAWTHGHDWSRLLQLESSGDYEFVFHGHTHQPRQHQHGSAWIINPGALYRASRYSCVVLDATSGRVEFIEVSPETRATAR